VSSASIDTSRLLNTGIGIFGSLTVCREHRGTGSGAQDIFIDLRERFDFSPPVVIGRDTLAASIAHVGTCRWIFSHPYYRFSKLIYELIWCRWGNKDTGTFGNIVSRTAPFRGNNGDGGRHRLQYHRTAALLHAR